MPLLEHEYINGDVGGLHMPNYDLSSIGHFRSPEGKRAYETSYAKAMKLLPEPTKTYDIQTGFGTVRAYKFANTKHPDGTPIIFQGLRWEIYVKTIPASLPFLPQSWRDAMLKDIGGNHTIDHADPIVQMIADASHYYALKLPTPDQITHTELQHLPMPVYVAMAEKSALHDAEAAVETAKTYVKDVSAKSWPGATHSLPMEFPQEIDRDLLGFITDHDPTRSKQ
jgi:hypothetical protein